MALTPFANNLHIIANLQDEPNDADGLTADELKAKFDEAGVLIQQYINATLLPEAAQEILGALEAAKRYTDEKVVDISAADMAMAVYDLQRKRMDVFDYADSAAQKSADKVRDEVDETYHNARWYGKDLIATSETSVSTSIPNQTVTAIAVLDAAYDGAEMLQPDKQIILVPAGVTRMLATVICGTSGAGASVYILVDGIVSGIAYAAQTFYSTTQLVIPVSAGAKIQVQLRATGGYSSSGHARLQSLRLEVLG